MTDGTAREPDRPAPHPLRDVALFFLRLGFTAFGGPAAHIAMMEAEVVRRRGWLRRDEFLDLLGATNLIPGPNSTEMAIFIGYKRAGWPGLVLGGACFILPAALITLAFAWAYVRFGSVPQVAALLYGVKPIIIAIVVQALWRLGLTAVKSRMLAVLAVLAVVASFAGLNPLVVLAGTGLLAVAAAGISAKSAGTLALRLRAIQLDHRPIVRRHALGEGRAGRIRALTSTVSDAPQHEIAGQPRPAMSCSIACCCFAGERNPPGCTKAAHHRPALIG